LKPFRGDTALELLHDFPNADPHRLNELFDGIFTIPAAHERFLDDADRILTGTVSVDQRQNDLWLLAAYLLAPSRYESQLETGAMQRPGIIFDLRDQTGYSFNMPGRVQSGPMPLPQMEFLARVVGTHFPEVAYPSGAQWGNSHPWDGTNFCRKLIDGISALPSEAATDALKRLHANPSMASYDAHLRHARANQRKLRRDSEYDRPNWPTTIKALSDGPPATVADLHALLLDQLGDLRTQITRANTDIYKFFWNLDSHSRPETPKPEEACRDVLVTLLRPALAQKDVTVEPEGHMLADKRADISAAMPGRKILCELKRDYHADIWTAADEQLERFYAHDPEAKGFGIYGVLWFGSKRSSSIPRHPDKLSAPTSADDLEKMLRERIPAERRSRLAVLVVDVSGPSEVKKKSAASATKKKRPTKKRKPTKKPASRKKASASSKPKKAAKKAAKKTRRPAKATRKSSKRSRAK
jgi:hypothetical protein